MKNFIKRRRLIFIIIGLLILSLVGWRIALSRSSLQPQYQTAQVEKGTLISAVSASGQIIAANSLNVTTSATGLVKKVFVTDGQTINRGQNLIEIELDATGQQKATSAWASYLSAKNSLESARATAYTLQAEMFSKWKTFKDLAESTSYDTSEERTLISFYIPQNEWLAAEIRYKNQETTITQAQASLNSAWLSYQQVSPIVTAPIAGRIDNLSVVPGMVFGGTKIASIGRSGPSLASFNFSEIDILKLKIGQKATVTIDALSDKTFTGKVVSIDRVGAVTNNVTNYPAIIQFDTEDQNILPNMSASANIILEAKTDILFVPSSAVQTQGEESFVRILKDGQAKQVSVQTGLVGDSQTEIVSGVIEGETIITGSISTSTNRQQSTSVFGGFGAGVFRGQTGGMRR